MASVGVPIKLLHEAIGHAVVIEMKNGELYRGHLDQVRGCLVWVWCGSGAGVMVCTRRRVCVPVRVLCMCLRTSTDDLTVGCPSLQAEDNMNVMLSKVQHTARDSRVSELSNVFLRGSQIRFVQLPEILKDAPMFKKVQATAAKAKPFARGGRGRGRGRGGA